MDVEYEDADFESNSRLFGEPVEMSKSWGDVIPWLEAFDEL